MFTFRELGGENEEKKNQSVPEDLVDEYLLNQNSEEKLLNEFSYSGEDVKNRNQSSGNDLSQQHLDEEMALVDAEMTRGDAQCLVVDDELYNIEVMKALISESMNISCDVALNGHEALKLFRERLRDVESGRGEMYKVCFLDYSMPHMDGIELT